MAEKPDPVEIASVVAQPSTRSFDTDYDRGPLLPGMELHLTLRNPNGRRTVFVVTDRASVDYDGATATLTVRLELPAFTSGHHSRIYPCVDPIGPKSEREIDLWIPLRFQELRTGGTGGQREVDATGWQHLALSVGVGTSPVPPVPKPATTRASAEEPTWPSVQRRFPRSALVGSAATKEEGL
jgi:hypothetical protein